jgi:3-hydroxyisobutyrate dehydrogenase
MGASMAGHLLRAGYAVGVHTRTKAKAAPVLDLGATWHESAGAAAAAADIVITMLGYPADVEATYLGAEGVVERGRPGALLIDMTTSDPRLAERISRVAESRGLMAIDAPVSGGDVGAREATLTIMVGGEPAACERALPVLRCLGRSIARLGGPGAGQVCKMANQIAVAVGMLAWTEALGFAQRAGLDPGAVHASISGGAAGSWAMSTLAPRALAGNFAPGFYAKHMLKDIGIALECAQRGGLDLAGLRCAQDRYEQVVARGWGECGTQVLFRLYGQDSHES